MDLLLLSSAQIKARPKSAHRYNVAEQQQVYREEIARIWKAQLDSLSNPIEPELSENEEEERDTDQVDSPSAVSFTEFRYLRKSCSYVFLFCVVRVRLAS